jgi:GNAT superfamily N-acetyltransferase
VTIELRRAGVDDVDVLLADVQAGFESYVEFAPAGWVPPKLLQARPDTIERLADPGAWELLAESDGHPAGHVAFVPGREHLPGATPGGWRAEPIVPGLAHLWQLFVLPDWWGQGVAAALHDAALEQMRSEEYRQTRLYTPSLHARARRFYERRGWSAVREGHNEYLRLMMTEYRRPLAG